MLTTLHGSWRRAAAIVLSEAVEGCRNDTAWIVIASAAGRGIPEDVVWELFEKHFRGWSGISEAQIASMIERTRPVHQPSAMTFIAPSSTGGQWQWKMTPTPPAALRPTMLFLLNAHEVSGRHTQVTAAARDDDELLEASERQDCGMAGQVKHAQPDAGARTILRINLRWRQRHGPRQDRGRHHRRLR